MTDESTLTAERLRELLDYDPETGIFRWKATRCGRALAGAIAGSTSKTDGYRHITVDDKLYRAHRMAWLYVYGGWPTCGLDHRNGNTVDNRIANLREATQAENTQNLDHSRCDNTNGYRGVTRNWNRWSAALTVGGKRHYLGTFDTPEKAHDAYLAAKAELHRFWAER